MKSHDHMMLNVLINGVIADAVDALKYQEFERDIQALTRLAAERGKGLFVLDLPALDSLLTTGLEIGRLKLHGPLTKRKSRKIQVPKLFSGLWLRIFNQDGALRSDACPTSIFFLRQIFCLFKRLKEDCSPSRSERNMDEYRSIDGSLREPSFKWNSAHLPDFRSDRTICFSDFVDDSVFSEFSHNEGSTCSTCESDFELLSRLQRVSDSFCKSIPVYFPACNSHIWRANGFGAIGAKHGPGAVSVKEGEKFTFSNYATPLRYVFPASLFLNKDENLPVRTEESRPSRLIAVPKTAKVNRLIAAEPVENQFFQQMTWRYLRESLKTSPMGMFINFSRQDLSRDMVDRSSIDRNLSTVDLSSASDRLSCATVERVFRKHPSLLDALWAHRSREITMPDGTVMPLKKFASQGAAVTFPVQSIVFALCALTACGVESIDRASLLKLKGKVRVFGDDIILPSNVRVDLDRLLTLLQLKVNKEKSFLYGHFRESCGKDSYMGYDVTPIKISTIDVRTNSGRLALLDQTNNSFLKGLWKTSEILKRILPDSFIKGIPVNNLSESPLRLLTFNGYDYSSLKMRWNRNLHRVEYLAYTSRNGCAQETLEGSLGLRAFLLGRQDPYLSNGYASSWQRSRVLIKRGWVSYPSSSPKLGRRFGN